MKKLFTILAAAFLGNAQASALPAPTDVNWDRVARNSAINAVRFGNEAPRPLLRKGDVALTNLALFPNAENTRVAFDFGVDELSRVEASYLYASEVQGAEEVELGVLRLRSGQRLELLVIQDDKTFRYSPAMDQLIPV